MKKNILSPNFFFQNQMDFLKENYIINDEEKYEDFTMSVRKMCHCTLEADHLIDRGIDFIDEHLHGENSIYSATKSFKDSLIILLKIFPDHTNLFWKEYDLNSKLYFKALFKEKFLSKQKTFLSLEDFKEYAERKHCLAYIPIVGLDILFSSKQNSDLVKEIFTHLFWGIQMCDDLDDFDDDFKSGQWTYVQSRVYEFMRSENIEEDSNLNRFHERLLYVSGIGAELIGYAQDQFSIARLKAENLSMSELINWIDTVQDYLYHNEKLITKLISK